MTDYVIGRRFGAQKRPCCDFCIGPNANWIFPTTPFILMPTAHQPMFVDDGEWGACEVCKADIEAENWLAIRSRLLENMRHDLRANEFMDEWSIQWHEQLVAAFHEHRIGPPRWDPD